MDWLALLKMIADVQLAENAEAIQAKFEAVSQALAQLQADQEAYVHVIGWAFAILGVVLMLIVYTFISIAWELHKARKRIKALEAAVSRLNESQDAVVELRAKFDKLIPHIEKAAGVAIV